MRYILLIFVGIVLTPLFLYASYGSILWILGYEFSEGPDVLAEKLINEKRPAKDCFLYRTLDLGPRPTTYELQMECVYEYASLTLDPLACELLLPSDYGWSCLGAAKEEGDICSINYGKYVEWWIESVYENPQKATLQECKQGLVSSEKGKKCCHILLLTNEEDVNDCSRFKSDYQFNDLCLSQLAAKLKDQEVCDSIVNENARIICEIRVKYKK
ncbi:TPA: hypothetical protein HA238_02725 [Candidatus Micrarchaeota archaeon]|nr:hypothetical protein [Candidatus Micrarchaeota archaeon]